MYVIKREQKIKRDKREEKEKNRLLVAAGFASCLEARCLARVRQVQLQMPQQPLHTPTHTHSHQSVSQSLRWWHLLQPSPGQRYSPRCKHCCCLCWSLAFSTARTTIAIAATPSAAVRLASWPVFNATLWIHKWHFTKVDSAKLMEI